MHRHVVAVLVMLIVVVLVTMHYLTYDTTTGQRKLPLPRDLGQKRAFQLERQKEDLIPICSWMKSPGGNPVGPTTLFSIRECLPMQRPQGKKSTTAESNGAAWQPLPERDIWVEVPAIKLITSDKITWEEIMGLYHQVYQLKRSPGEVPCSEEIAEEICIEILEMLKEHLQHREGPATQPEEELRWRTSRMPVQAEFHDQMQVTYDHFGHFRSMQQESWEEALRVARDAHCLLAAAAMLEGHIEWLSHSISWGQHGSQGWLGSKQCSRSRRCTQSCRRHLLAGQGEQVPPMVDHTGDPTKRWAASPSPIRPQRQVDLLKTPALGGIQM